MMKITIPSELGDIFDSVEFDNDKHIVIIPKRVTNPYPYELSTARVLEHLANNYGMRLVMVDGADGLVDTSWFKTFPCVEIRNNLSLDYMKEGQITGAEHFSITTDYDPLIIGLEKIELFIESRNLIGEIQAYVGKFHDAAEFLRGNILKKRILNGDPSTELEAKIREYDSRDMQINTFFLYLSQKAKEYNITLWEKHPEFALVAKKMEDPYDIYSMQLNFLRKALGETDIKDKKDVEENLASRVNIKQAIARLAMVDGEDTVTRELRVAMAGESHARLASLYNNILVMTSLTMMQGTPMKFEYFKQKRHEFNGEYIADQLKRYDIQVPSSIISAINAAVPIMERFYEIAEERQDIFAKITLETMQKQNVVLAVMNFVGFNESGVLRNLNKEKVSYTRVAISDAKD
jgi:hypothetical protein